MKKTVICLLGLGGLAILPSCVNVTKREPVTRTTTIEETSVSRPVGGAVETQTMQRY